MYNVPGVREECDRVTEEEEKKERKVSRSRVRAENMTKVTGKMEEKKERESEKGGWKEKL